MKYLFLFFIFIAFFSKPLYASDLVVELLDDKILVNSGFKGQTLSVVGTKKIDAHVSMSIFGPSKKAITRQKSDVFGAWINKYKAVFDDVPSFHRNAYHLKDAEFDETHRKILRDNRMCLRSQFADINLDAVSNNKATNFKEAFIQNMNVAKLYDNSNRDLEMLDDNFFKFDVYLPANVPTGEYKIKTILFDDIQVLSTDIQTLKVEKFGLNALIYSFANEYTFIYGLLCIGLALLSGWGINILRRQS